MEGCSRPDQGVVFTWCQCGMVHSFHYCVNKWKFGLCTILGTPYSKDYSILRSVLGPLFMEATRYSCMV